MVSTKILPYMETNEMRAPPPPEASEDGTPKHGSKVSPYASPSCKVYFKSGKLFRIPRDLLCEALESIRRSSNEIRLKNVPDEAGHVLIHYLHTGKWQFLESEDLRDAAKDLNWLEVSLHVYAMAQTYDMPELAEMAKRKPCLYMGVSALQILVSASDACQLMGEDDLWFSTYIKRRVERLFKDTASLDKARFLMCFDTATPYSKMLVGFMFEICCKISTPFYPESTTPQTGFGTEATPKSEVNSLFDCAGSDPEALELDEDCWQTQKSSRKKNMRQIAEPEPEIVELKEPEPVEGEKDYDRWELPSAKVSKKKKKKAMTRCDLDDLEG